MQEELYHKIDSFGTCHSTFDEFFASILKWRKDAAEEKKKVDEAMKELYRRSPSIRPLD